MEGASASAFFYAAKFLWMLAVPSTALTLLAGIGLLVAWHHPRAGWWMTALGVLGLVGFGLGPFGRVLAVPLENRFPAFVDDGRPVAGVVVLGGSERPDIAAARGQPALTQAGERLMALADLSRRYPEARILFSGGSGDIGRPPLSEADVVRMALPQLGVDPARVSFEAASRNTAENAALSRELARPAPGERWLLVTSALHMPRAMGCFEAAGFPVIAYPVDYRTTGAPQWTRPFARVSEGLEMTDAALREWIGLVAYRLTGRIDRLLPGPGA
ncbi:YdcF family protein [Ancylobacter oerskovii]|uniref:YdcF family protein n=1 Tax=Ancylobacter oerskovii TaxID=459519 RepID=A0ABW4Z1W4_9HYPH|nr:YdcF family protein [Ancylobacter oerskovii]MBS7544987.1 YdcF family protein [Ancylobacter oerskovii]